MIDTATVPATNWSSKVMAIGQGLAITQGLVDAWNSRSP
jgi:hypothetical protein